jgi:[NiFe] hydrogenase diaphorase moiety large subunit
MASVDAALISRVVERFGKDPQRLMDIVREVHSELGHISEETVDAVAHALGIHRVQVADMASFYSFFEQAPGARYLIGLRETSCTGMCDQAPAALINGLVVTGIKPADVPAIVEALKQEKGKPGGLFPNAEVQLNLRQAGPVVLGPFENGSAIRKALALSPEQVIEEINKSKLRGRGGAGFPTGMKWNFCRKAKGKHFLICNADEGEPGTFKDRLLLTEAADLLFEGMTVAGYALGAVEGLLYLRAEYAYLWPRLEQVLSRRRRHGLLGQNIAGREGFGFDIRIQMGAGAYVCGEESGLIESLEGKRGAPRDRPPYPVQRGYQLEPTSVNNVETLCCAARVMEKGADWFAKHGTRDSTGTKLLSVSGDCARPGVYEVEYGLTVGKLLELVGGDDAQAVQVGGPSGACLAPRDYGRKIAFEDIATGGSIIVFGPKRDLLKHVLDFTEFFAEESCGWCAPCRVGTTLLVMKLKKILEGRGTASDLDELKTLGTTVKTMSRCGLGQSAANPVLTTLQNLPELYRQRITDQDFIPYFDITAAFSEQAAVTGRKFVDHEEAHA